MPKNLSAQIVCPSQKDWDFDEKRLYWASVLRAWNDGLASNHQPKVSKSNNLAENNYYSVSFTYHTMIFALIFVC